MASESRNLAQQRREKDGIVYFERGILTGRDGRRYQRYAIQTHFVEVGGKRGGAGEEVCAAAGTAGRRAFHHCEGDGDVHRQCPPHGGHEARLLFAKHMAKFAGINSTGVGMHEPYKLQLVIDMVGLPRVLLAGFVSAVTRPFGVKGLFYKICGHGVAGIDGFYFRSSFDRYKTLALINPEHPVELSNEIEKECGIPIVIMDANDIDQNQLGKCDDFPLTDDQIQDAMKDNPSGQGGELTPLILIRPLA
ncbi:MAG: F420-0--gamma-glutamyl ligase [Christensenellales bacterium]